MQPQSVKRRGKRRLVKRGATRVDGSGVERRERWIGVYVLCFLFVRVVLVTEVRVELG